MSLETSNSNANEKLVTILIQVNALENSRQSISNTYFSFQYLSKIIT